jgi:hypothetical protein
MNSSLKSLLISAFVATVLPTGCASGDGGKSAGYSLAAPTGASPYNGPKAFKQYDAAFIDAVTQRWYALLHATTLFPFQHHTGKVVLRFILHSDGRVTGLEVLHSDVGFQLTFACKEAVLASAPFPHFTDDMLKILGEDYRDVTFTFYYRGKLPPNTALEPTPTAP